MKYICSTFYAPPSRICCNLFFGFTMTSFDENSVLPNWSLPKGSLCFSHMNSHFATRKSHLILQNPMTWAFLRVVTELLVQVQEYEWMWCVYAYYWNATYLLMDFFHSTDKPCVFVLSIFIYWNGSKVSSEWRNMKCVCYECRKFGNNVVMVVLGYCYVGCADSKRIVLYLVDEKRGPAFYTFNIATCVVT